ncbi:MAG: OmpH family outer membrane protein [Planctomycetota bacterium]
MNKQRVCALLIALLLLGVGSSARCGEAVLNIRVFRIQEIFEKSQRAQAMKKNIEEMLSEEKKNIERLDREAKKMEEDLRADTLTEAGSFPWFQKKQDIATKRYLIETKKKSFEQTMNAEMATYYKTIYEDMQWAIATYAKQNGVHLVLRATDEALTAESFIAIQNEITLKMLHYYDPALDCTQPVLEYMDQRWRELQARQNASGKK